jgi:hypothetical protein
LANQSLNESFRFAQENIKVSTIFTQTNAKVSTNFTQKHQLASMFSQILIKVLSKCVEIFNASAKQAQILLIELLKAMD